MSWRECFKCGFSWTGYRVMPKRCEEFKVIGYVKLTGDGPTVCPRCLSMTGIFGKEKKGGGNKL